MSVGLVTIVSLSAGVTLAIFGAALVFLVLWQDYRRRSNQYFALCMTIFSLYGALSLPLHTAQQFDVDPVVVVHMVAGLYVAGVVLLFNFVLSFAGLPRPLRWRERLFSMPIALLILYLASQKMLFTDFEPVSGGGTYNYSMTAWGYAGVTFLVSYLVLIFTLLRRVRTRKAQDIAIPSLFLASGMLIFTATPNLREFPLNTTTVIITVFMMGRVVLKYQVFKPLSDVNETLIQKNEELINATQAKAQFLANMSHELRTPLNSIIGYTELVGAGTYGDLNERQRDRIQKVTRNGRLLLELINDVLDLSRLEAGRMELTCSQVDTVSLLDRLLAEHGPQAREKGLSLVRGYSALPPLYVDETRTRQILDNLLSNAIKFTETGAVIVRGYADSTRQQVVLSVADTGPGIAHENQEIVFDVFGHGDNDLVRHHEGTGLGLAIARRLTDLHGGNLWFESVVGQGSTFHVALPAAGLDSLPDPVVVPRRRGSGPVILAIDDDHEAIELLQDQLEPAKYRVYGARSVNSGLQLAYELRPALITLDVRMPDMDGWRVLETLRSDPATAETPVLIISSADAHETARKVGADGFLSKPVQPELLLKQVKLLAPRGTSPLPALPAKRPENAS